MVPFFRRNPKELSLTAITALSWLGLFICQRVQAGFDDPRQTVCIDGGTGCAKILHNPKFVFLGLHPHEWGAIFFIALIILCLMRMAVSHRIPARILSLALHAAAFLGVITALISGYAQYTLIHQICPLCFTLDCILLLIAAATLLGNSGKFPSSAESEEAPDLASESSPPLPRLILLNIFGLAVLALLTFAVKTGDRKSYLPHIATVNGEPIYQYELEEEAAPDTYQQDLDLYAAQKPVLERLIGEKLIRMAAKKEGNTVAQYLAEQKIPDDASATASEMRQALVERLRAVAKVKSFLQSPIPPVLEKIPQDGILIGNSKARLQIVCFTDFECPYCRKMAPVLDAFQERHPEDVSIVYCQLPLAIHPLALPAAKAAYCADQQGKFLDYERQLFSADPLSLDAIRSTAKKCNLDLPAFSRCLKSAEIHAKAERAIDDATTLGIRGTPRLYFNGKLQSVTPDILEFEKIYEGLPLKDK
jgi:protein-disulfide isomerase/uncharacterized membrane protein